MYFPQQVSYVIRRGDNLYQLAKFYHTTVPMILNQNPNINPYNLKIGTTIIIHPGENFNSQPGCPNPQACPNFDKQTALTNEMRGAWMQHVYWTRMLLLSIAERLNDLDEVTARLLQNPNDIASIYANYYGPDVTAEIARLLTEHLQIGAELITALRDQQSTEADDLTRQWYANADQMAAAFSSFNPNYDQEELRNMFYDHLGLTTQEVAMRLAGNYQADIEAFNEVEQEILSMADDFTAGIIKQFPNQFN